MDQFEAARLRHEKKLAKQLEPKTVQFIPIPELRPEPQVPALLVHKEKSQDGIIEVKVTLPNREFSFSLKKRGVLSNMNPSRATPEEFAKAIKTGLVPLLGATE